MWAEQALERFIDEKPRPQYVLDIGSGTGEHAKVMHDAGIEVTTCDINGKADISADFNIVNLNYTDGFDGIWASHVLEHQPNPGHFLEKCLNLLMNDGLFAVTVPPRKDEIVGGHVTLWNQGLLLYNLVLAGFDCRKARVSPLYEGYNISVLVRKVRRPQVPLRMDAGDIEALAEYFPFPVEQGFNGWGRSCAW